MPALVAADPVTSAPLALRTIKVGLLGLGQVNQAVARIVPDATRLKDAGLRFRVAGALVRDIGKPRRCIKPTRITSNPSAFLRGNYDVVIEALGTVEPARSLVRRLLGRGIPVVTANKALVAAHGAELTSLAARRGTSLRYEASALAGVPFLGAFAARPLVSDVQQFTAIVNGTSNYILSKLEQPHCTFERALADARTHGLTEPDPMRDLEGIDAADKLGLLSTIFGWGTLPSFRVETQGITQLTPHDFAIAHALDSTIKPVVCAARSGAGISAFVGPALVPRSHPLAALRGALSGIHIQGGFVSDLFFSGPGAGPDITAATLLDDAVEAVSTISARPAKSGVAPRVAPLAAAPATEWLIRVAFPGLVPDASTTAQLFGSHHVQATFVTDVIDNQRWVRTTPLTREAVEFALERLTATHRFHTFAIRAL